MEITSVNLQKEVKVGIKRLAEEKDVSFSSYVNDLLQKHLFRTTSKKSNTPKKRRKRSTK
jgi:hypothetical protein